MDTVADLPHFNRSIFSEKNKTFWVKTISWRNKYVDGDKDKGLVYRGVLSFMNNTLDAWHIFQSLMVVFFIMAIFFALKFDYSIAFSVHDILNYIIELLACLAIYGFVWNRIFTLFYKKLLTKWNQKQ